LVLANNEGKTVPIKIRYVMPDAVYKRKKIPAELRAKANKRGSRCLVYVEAIPVKGLTIYGHAYCCPKDDPKLGTGIILAFCMLSRAANEIGWKVTA